MSGNEVHRISVSIIGLSIGIMIFLLSSPPWTLPSTAVVYYSILAFLCITITVCSLNRIRTDPTVAHSFFSAGTLYASIVFGGAAIFYVYSDLEPVTHLFTSGIFLNLIAFATTGIGMLLYSYLQRNSPKEKSVFNNRFLPHAYLATGLLLFVALLVISRTFIDRSFFLFWGYLVGLVSLCSYLGAAVILFRSRRILKDTHDPLRLSLSFVILATASLNHMLLLPNPNVLWLGSIALMVMAFIYAIVATGYSYLLDINVEKSVAYGISIAISILVVVPFLFIQIIEGFFIQASIIEIGTPLLIHIGGCIFAASLTFAMYIRSRNQKGTYVYPIMTIFLFWTIAEFALFLSHLIPIYAYASETRVPYIAGSIVTILFLIAAVRQILHPTEGIRGTYSFKQFAFYAIIFSLMLGLGEIIQKYLFDTFPEFYTGLFGTSLMLGLSYVSLFLLLDFFLLFAGLSGGKINFDSLAIGSLTIWLVIIIMKANFSVWTVGYWVAEVVMAISVAIFPVLLLHYFINEYQRNRMLENNALIYSRFLTARIASHHASAIDTLDGMIKDSGSDEKCLDSISKALQEISFAEELTQTICSVLQENRFSKETMEAMDLVDIIIDSIDRLLAQNKALPQIKINKERGSCYVTANALLIDAYQKLFEGVIQRIGNIRGLDIAISQEAFDVRPSWHTTLTIEVVSQNASKTKHLFDRYTRNEWSAVPEFAFAYRLVHLFGGSISSESIIGASSQLWLIVKLQLPSTPAI